MSGSSVIGALRVNLGLDAAQFTTGLKQAQSSMSAVAARLGKVAASITAAAVPAMTALGVSAINSAAEIKRFSQVANATPQEFQRWAAGAKAVGIEQEKMADILKDVNDRVGDFVATGGGPMADFFERVAPKVGVAAEQFRNLSGPQALQLYVDTLQKANLNQQDFTFFMEAMASDSTLLIPLLRDNGRAMTEIGNRAQAMGAIMSGDMLAAFNTAKTSLTDMQLAATGVRNSLAVIAIPAITAVAAALAAMATALHEHAGTIQTVLTTLAGTVAVVATVFAVKYATAIGLTAVRAMASAVAQSIALEVALGAQSRAAAMAGVATKALSGTLVVLRGALISTGIGALVVGAGYLVAKLFELVRATGGWGNAMSLLGDVAAGVWDGIKGSAASIPIALDGVWESAKASFFEFLHSLSAKWVGFLRMMSAVPGMSGLNETSYDIEGGFMSDMGLAVDAAKTRAAALRQQASDIASAGFERAAAALAQLSIVAEDTSDSVGDSGLGGGLASAGNSASGTATKLSDLERVMKSLRDEAERLKATQGMSDLEASIWEKQKEAGVSASSAQGQRIAGYAREIDSIQRLRDATDEWKQSITSAFSSFITQGGSFKKVLGEIIGKLAEMLMNRAFENLWSTSSGGGFLGGVMKIFGFSNGTNFAPGGLARVNERGGEIINLPRGSQVIPHDISKRMASKSGGAPVINFHVDARGASEGVDVLIARELQKATPKIVNQALGAVKAAGRRGQ